MKPSIFVFLMAAALAAHSQTAAKPAVHAAKPATSAHAASTAGAVKLPPNVPVVHGIVKTAFSLRYEDVKIGTGADAEPMKMYKIKYTGWRLADGVKFDAWDDHRQPVLDKDGKPVTGEDGKPKLSDPEPASFPVGFGRVIPGFDQGFNGMKVGGKRRLFIPWQLAYGTREMPDHGADHPGIPAKSDLIFDVELIDITDMPMPASHPGMGGMPGGTPGGMPPHPAGTVHAVPPTPDASAKPAAPATPPAQPTTPPQTK